MFESYSDAELVKVLDEQGFAGPMWDRFADALARSGLKIITPWIASNRIFDKLRKKKIRYRTRGRVEHHDDAEELAGETVALAIVKFRDDMLVNYRWSPDGGASLKATFITQCLFQFPNAYRRWAKEKGNPSELLGEGVGYQADERGRCDRGIGLDPAVTVIDKLRCQQLLARLSNDMLRAQLQLYGMGYPYTEGAKILGVSAKLLENQRHRDCRKLMRDAEEAE